MIYTRDGQDYEVIAIRRPELHELIIDGAGRVVEAGRGFSAITGPIVRPIVPEWITPTDEHAKQRPTVEVRNRSDSCWHERKLVYVGGGEFPFHTTFAEGDACGSYKYCRMRNPDYREPS